MKKTENLKGSIDLEWIQLLQEAREIGLTPQEVREFIESADFSPSSNPKIKLSTK
ncbi:anti-repressor SinI family protein [Bacillus sp. FJAT-47783]|uniref:anti-repressor SinI family protein n=1 Tax=Bacillus sp. FJAT-47783 TaxID=2922712 RepID=UPI001FACF5AF|nr:anti-repressor SinI family protein [Bacillus sp. FJAT-47783]